MLAIILPLLTNAKRGSRQTGDVDIGGLLSDLMGAMVGNSDGRGRIIERRDYTVIEDNR
jgi:hypothetical protein